MRSRIYSTIAVLVIGLMLGSCAEDKLTGEEFTNEPPSVWLSAAPPEGTTTSYTIHLYWGGWDPDGEISHYEYLISDNDTGVFNPVDTVGAPWGTVIANDSIFNFTADVVSDSTDFRDGRHEPEEFVRSHTFFIRAVDERGVRSAKPAYRSFTARTLSPIVDVVIPPRAIGGAPALVPPITTFQWVGKDYIGATNQEQEPESVRTIIVPAAKFGDDWTDTADYIQRSPNAEEWSKWQFYRAPGDTGKTWTSPPLAFGRWVFAVQVKDEAGAVSPVFDIQRNLRRVLVSARTSGPVLRVRNDYIGQIVTSSPNTPLIILDLPAGVPMRFEFDADASSYGGVVSGYRYGWDILDLNDPEQWEIDFTPFIGTEGFAPARTFFFGTHTFYVEVIDNSGFKSRVGVRINIVPFRFTRNLLLIDDWQERNPGGWGLRGVLPSDEEHDAFWLSMVDSVDGFNPGLDHIQLGTGGGGSINEVPIQTIADYKAMIWHTAPDGLVASVIRFVDPDVPSPGGRVTPNIIALYMAAGGHVLLCGQNVMTHVINQNAFGNTPRAFPFIFRYELKGDQDGSYADSEIGERGVGDNSFAYKECCLNILDKAGISNPAQIRNPANAACRVDDKRSYKLNTEGLRACIPIDPDFTFPRLELRPETAGLGKENEFKGIQSDVYNPPYFADLTDPVARCPELGEITDPWIPEGRDCFQPMFGIECNDTSSPVFGAPVAFWTSEYVDIEDGGVGARSAIWGFYPVYFKPDQVKQVMYVLLFDEWQLPRK